MKKFNSSYRVDVVVCSFIVGGKVTRCYPAIKLIILPCRVIQTKKLSYHGSRIYVYIHARWPANTLAVTSPHQPYHAHLNTLPLYRCYTKRPLISRSCNASLVIGPPRTDSRSRPGPSPHTRSARLGYRFTECDMREAFLLCRLLIKEDSQLLKVRHVVSLIM